MDILELKNQRVKISPRSITCRNEYGKTCGVVRNTQLYTQARPAEQMKYHKFVRECGIWGHPELAAGLILCDGQLYYLHNLRPLEAYEHFMKDRPGFENETNHYNHRKQAAEKIAEFATVIPCYIEK